MNRNFLITGGAGGIGEALSRNALESGGKVFFTDVNEENGTRVKKELQKEFGNDKVGFSVQNVSDAKNWVQVWDEAERFFEGKVETLVNNAGVYGLKTSTNLDIVNINLIGTILGTHEAVKRMSIENGGYGGTIIQIGSSASFLSSSASPLYSASKHGILGFVRSFDEKEFLRTKVRVVGLCPSLVDTKMIRSALGKLNGDLTSQYGMRALQPFEVAETLNRLIVTGESGQVLFVYPGFSFYWPDIQMFLFKSYCNASKFLIRIYGHKNTEPIQSTQFLTAAFLFFIFICFVMHILLVWIGI